MTLKNIYDEVAALVKISFPADSENALILANALNMALTELTKDGRMQGGRVDTTLVLAAWDNAGIPLPDDFLRMDRVTFTSGNRDWTIEQHDGRIPVAPIPGKATSYVVSKNVSGVITDPAHKIRFGPRNSYDVGDSALVEYWQNPPWRTGAEWTTDQNFNESAEVIEMLVARAAAWVYIYQNKLQQAQALASVASPPSNANQTAN